MWQPRDINFAKGILIDFGFKQIVDMHAGDGAWALANLKMEKPVPYVGLTLCAHHNTFLTKIVQAAVRAAMATDGHAFCDHESQALVTLLFPEEVKALQEEDEEENFPEEVEDEADAESAGSDPEEDSKK